MSALEKFIKSRIPQLTKKHSVTSDELEKIEKDSEAAKELLEDPRFEFLREYFKTAQTSITDMFVQNRLKPTKQYFFGKDIVTAHTISRRESENEASGQYKFIDKLLNDLKTTAGLYKEYKEAIDQKKVKIEDQEEDE